MLPRSQQRWLHIHAFAADLVSTHERSGETALLLRAVELVKDWRRTFSHPRDADTMAFHDETVAQRLNHWLCLFLALRNAGLEEEAKTLWDWACETVQVLTSEGFHAGLNNHGMFQDRALLCFSVLADDAKQLQVAALRRLVAYFKWSVCADGVHREHSPNYHFLISRNIAVLLPLVRAVDARIAAVLDRVLRSMGRYAVAIVAPDGTLPPIGDTPPRPVPSGYWDTFPGASARQAPPRAAFFPFGGYAILRNDPLLRTQQTWAVLCASHHGTYHKHRDDLSVLLYSGGWIITESGPFGYDYQRGESIHAYSSAAHSTLLVDEENPSRTERTPIGLVGLGETGDDEEGAVATGVNRRLNGVVHTRQLALSRSEPLVRVHDLVRAETPRRLSLIWQIAPDLRALVIGKECHLMRGEEKVAKLCVESSADTALELLHGDMHPVFKGLNFPRMGAVQNAPVLRVTTPPLSDYQVSTTFVMPRRTVRGPKLPMQVAAGDWPIQYHIESHVDSRALVVAFPALATKFRYQVNYKNVLARVAATKVFLTDDFGPQGSYLIASGGDLALADAVLALIESVREHHGVPRERVLLLGSSKGGASALYFAHRLGWGSVVVGAPQTRIGHFLLNQDLTNGPTIANYMFPQPDAKDRLDRLIYDQPVSTNVPRYIHVGRGDHHYRQHVLPYVEHVRKAGADCQVELAEYASHKDVGKYFPDFVRRCLCQLLPDLLSGGLAEQEVVRQSAFQEESIT